MTSNLLITGLCPDIVNTNSRIRGAVFEGAVATGLFDDVKTASLEVVLARGALNFTYVLAVGGGASDTVAFETLRRRCRSAGAKLIFWTHEDPYEFDLNQRIQPISDFYFSNDRSTLNYYEKPGTQWLPLGADLHYLRKLDPTRLRSVDLFFCGYGYPMRLHILECLIGRGDFDLNIALHGPNLIDTFPNFADARKLSTWQMAEIASRSYLVLNIGRDLGIANSRFSISPETPGPRTFDIALSGVPQIIFDDGVAIEEFYDVGHEILTFSHPDEIAAAVRRLWDDPTYLESVASASQRRTLNNHLYKHRIATMFDRIQND